MLSLIPMEYKLLKNLLRQRGSVIDCLSIIGHVVLKDMELKVEALNLVKLPVTVKLCWLVL